MVETNARTALGATARRFADLITGDRVSYTPEALNRMVTTIVHHELAGRLRELAIFHHAAASELADGSVEEGWHLREASRLDILASRELLLLELGRGEVR